MSFSFKTENWKKIKKTRIGKKGWFTAEKKSSDSQYFCIALTVWRSNCFHGIFNSQLRIGFMSRESNSSLNFYLRFAALMSFNTYIFLTSTLCLRLAGNKLRLHLCVMHLCEHGSECYLMHSHISGVQQHVKIMNAGWLRKIFCNNTSNRSP